MNKNNVVSLTDDDVKRGHIFNALTSAVRRLSAALYGESPDGKRNYKTLYGYLETISYDDNRGMYQRGGIAHTVVAKIAKACWRDMPEVKQGDTVILENELLELVEVGFFKAFERADILNRIGRLSVLFIGVPDGLEPDQPLGTGGNIKDLYFNVYGEDGVIIKKWDMDPSSKRFNLPVIYQLTVTNLTSPSAGLVGSSIVNVHYTRVVHLAEGALENTIEGCSALEPVWNALIDKDKVRGGSGEAFYRNARQKFALQAHKDARLDTSSTANSDLNDEVQAFQNDLQDFIRLQNMDMTVVQPNIADPQPTWDIIVEEISGQTGIPIRILTGKGGGQLTGSEDKATWNALTVDRQDHECTPWFIEALRILNAAGAIKNLPDIIEIEWPEQSALSAKEAAEVAQLKGNAISQISAALSTPAGSEIEIESVLKSIGLDDIEVDDSDIPILPLN